MGRASITATTCSSGHGSIVRTRRLGSFTDPARHGFVAMSPSSTAALNTAETFVKIVRT
jgi:hypothetical protein